MISFRFDAHIHDRLEDGHKRCRLFLDVVYKGFGQWEIRCMAFRSMLESGTALCSLEHCLEQTAGFRRLGLSRCRAEHVHIRRLITCGHAQQPVGSTAN